MQYPKTNRRESHMNRRDFIKSGTGAFAIASAGRAFGDAAASNRVRLAIVG